MSIYLLDPQDLSTQVRVQSGYDFWVGHSWGSAIFIDRTNPLPYAGLHTEVALDIYRHDAVPLPWEVT